MKSRAAVFLILSGAVAALLSSFVFLYFNMIGLEPAFFKTFYTDLVPSAAIVPLVLLSLLAGFIVQRKAEEKAPAVARAVMPAWLLFPLLPFPCFFSVTAFIFIAMIVTWRIAQLCGWHFPAWKRTPTLLLLAAGTLAGLAWGIYMQNESFSRLWFTYTDWTEYYEGYLRLRHSLGRPLMFLYNAGHFNPLPNILITPFVALFPDPRTLFVLNSIFIYSLIPVWYWLARTLGFGRCPAALTALALMLHFTVPNLNLSLFYGFHPIVMFPALLAAFYCFYRKGNRIGTGLCFVLILLLQETTAVFWFGWGIYLILKRRYWQGALLAAFSCAWFAFTVKVICPAVKRILYDMPESWNSNYVQTFHYAELGGSITDILLAPFVRTVPFLEKLCNPLNFAFAGVILLAFFPLATAAPRLLAASLPLLLGIFMMGGADALNISMWYQTEIFAILTVASAAGYLSFRRNGNLCMVPFAAGIPAYSRRRRATAAVFAVLAGMVLCGVFFGRLPVGKYAFSRIQERPDCSGLIAEIKSKMPPDAFVLTNRQMQIHFIGRSGNIMDAAEPYEADYVLTYLDDLHVDFEKNRARYERMKADPRYEALLTHEVRGCNLILYRKK